MNRKELIDFIKWHNKEYHWSPIAEWLVDDYLASINSSTSNEALTLCSIEGKGKICVEGKSPNFCGHSLTGGCELCYSYR